MSVNTCIPTTKPVTMTQAALQHLQKQLRKAGHGIGIRLGVKKYGCTGYGYTVDIIDQAAADDRVYPVGENCLVAVAPQHLPYLQGTCIDFVKEGLNQHFKFLNPNEKHNCGCGESFSIE